MSTQWTFEPSLRPSLAVAGSAARFPVRRIYCIGRNYLAHIREMGEADERDLPIFFQKPTDSIVEEGVPVPYPSATSDYQYEAELVVAIGRAGEDIAPEAAHEYIYGYAVGLEMTRRDLQRAAARAGHPWENGKAFDHSSPCGAIVPASVCGHPKAGALRLLVNGALRQKTDLSQLIWNVPEIIANLSRLYHLMPGDLVYTGTPDGVGPVVPGDKLEASVEGVGTFHALIAPHGA
ncbi:MAG TPA: fumarylacetoacetate hydrolase family protein [Burkholderiales bacterium]|jgi:fumarylpyruvate hydrolase